MKINMNNLESNLRSLLYPVKTPLFIPFNTFFFFTKVRGYHSMSSRNKGRHTGKECA